MAHKGKHCLEFCSHQVSASSTRMLKQGRTVEVHACPVTIQHKIELSYLYMGNYFFPAASSNDTKVWAFVCIRLGSRFGTMFTSSAEFVQMYST